MPRARLPALLLVLLTAIGACARGPAQDSGEPARGRAPAQEQIRARREPIPPPRGPASPRVETPRRRAGEGPLVVHFFDVGQGDAALILSPTGKSVLIDGGPPEAGEALARRVDALVDGPLDLVVLSHPHLDHLGGLTDVLERVGTRRFLDPGFDHPSEAYRDLLTFLADRGIEVRTPELAPQKPDEPVTVGLGGGASLTVLWPRRPVEPFLDTGRSDANANSIVARLTHGRVAVLFMGDAEKATEKHLLALGAPLKAQVLKVGHHGSKHASTKPFLARVQPEVAVISCGRGNEYGHPAKETLARLGSAGARVVRTDQVGEVRFTSDGERYTITPEPQARGSRPARNGTP
ncbi:MAG: MBL fold metallo-hydrolase [Myxococcaceae bacterium]|nr:MBL fold metallo-hydrolase [Myxococcaceae bacterium]MCI0670038.1 MBL fold metallo-hydrolase [Myxococcaceae bacterium]